MLEEMAETELHLQFPAHLLPMVVAAEVAVTQREVDPEAQAEQVAVVTAQCQEMLVLEQQIQEAVEAVRVLPVALAALAVLASFFSDTPFL